METNKIVFEDRNGNMIYYIYNNEELLGFKYNDNIYYYHKNIFGDIIGIFNDNYNEIAKYDYDSRGNILSIEDISDENIANINPFRYRSYYYDNETEMYYLNTRYYNPKTRRFINADIILTNQNFYANNLYNYCYNNPIFRIDNEGNFPILGLVIAGVIGAVTSAYYEKKENPDATTGDLILSGTIGAAEGCLTFAFPQYGLAIGFGSSVLTNGIDVATGEQSMTEATLKVGTAFMTNVMLDEAASHIVTKYKYTLRCK